MAPSYPAKPAAVGGPTAKQPPVSSCLPPPPPPLPASHTVTCHAPSNPLARHPLRCCCQLQVWILATSPPPAANADAASFFSCSPPPVLLASCPAAHHAPPRQLFATLPAATASFKSGLSPPPLPPTANAAAASFFSCLPPLPLPLPASLSGGPKTISGRGPRKIVHQLCPCSPQWTLVPPATHWCLQLWLGWPSH